MKLVLKNGNVIKLYNQAFDYNSLLDFVQKEMMIKKETINMSYTDEEGDQISIASNEDLSIMENLIGDKAYVKISVTGDQKQQQPEALVRTVVQEKSDQKVEEKIKPRHPAVEYIEKLKVQQEAKKKLAQIEEKERRSEEERLKKIALQEEKQMKQLAQQEQRELKKKLQQQERERKKKIQKEENERKRKLNQQQKQRKRKIQQQEMERKKEEQRLKNIALRQEKLKKASQKKEKKLTEKQAQSQSDEQKGQIQKKKLPNNFNTFNRLMAESVSALVDERVRALVPFLKEQIANDDKLEDLTQTKVVHKNFTCKICTSHPIIGIRYDCPKCEEFSICERCQTLYDHQHNLIKVKKLDEERVGKKAQPSIKKLYENFFTGQALHEEKKLKKDIQETTVKFSQKEKKKDDFIEEVKAEKQQEEPKIKVEEKVQQKVEKKIEIPAHLLGEKRQAFIFLVDVFGPEKASEYTSFIEKNAKEGKDKIIELWSNNVSVYHV